MTRPILILVAFFLMLGSAFALPVIINGHSAAGSAFVFRVYEQSDPISGLEVLLDQQRPDEEGKFKLQFNIDEIKDITIKVGLQSAQIYVIPGNSYELDFNEITLEDQNLFLPQQALQLTFIKEDMLNLVIGGFDFEYQRFLGNKFIELIKLRDKSIYRKFEENIKAKLKDTPIQDSATLLFFNNYIDYRMAEIKLSGRIVEKQKLGLEMITQRNIDLNNMAYAQFFNQYFDQYLLNFEEGSSFRELRKLLNMGLPIHQLFDKLGQDPVLVKEKLRELVLLLSIKQVFYSRDMSKESLNEILSYLSNKSKFEYNRMVAANLLVELNRFIAGHAVPSFNLSNLYSESKQLNNYKGKKTYLMFVSPNCETCEADIRVLKVLLKSHPDLQVLTVLAGFNEEESTEWAKEQKAPWDFLWFNDDFALLAEYKIKNFPKYLLLDEEALLLNYFPPSPRENLSTYLKVLSAQEEKEKGEASDFFRKN